jgi:hypothetical protein
MLNTTVTIPSTIGVISMRIPSTLVATKTVQSLIAKKSSILVNAKIPLVIIAFEIQVL